MTLAAPFGPELSQEETSAYSKMEVWGTMFDPSANEDYCEFRLFQGDQLVKTVRADGY